MKKEGHQLRVRSKRKFEKRGESRKQHLGTGREQMDFENLVGWLSGTKSSFEIGDHECKGRPVGIAVFSRTSCVYLGTNKIRQRSRDNQSLEPPDEYGRGNRDQSVEGLCKGITIIQDHGI